MKSVMGKANVLVLRLGAMLEVELEVLLGQRKVVESALK
jgi:hypothetical protein